MSGFRTAVFGTGSWGTAFASVLADAGGEVCLWGRRPEVCEAIARDHVNAEYLPDLQLPPTVTASNDPQVAAEGADMVVLAVTAQTLRENLQTWGHVIPAGVPVVSLIKGIELGTTKRMSEVMTECGIERERVVVLSGPNLSGEIAAKQPAATVVACSDVMTAERVADACATPYFRPYTQVDVVGTEIAGAVKNVVALAVGMAEGMGFGDNTKSTIITRGLAETARLGVALGADFSTFQGLAGVGDLIATCMSPLSRNHTFGVKIGSGMTFEEVLASTKRTTEGVKSCRSILDLAREHHVDVPIVQTIVGVLEGELNVKAAAEALMTRARKFETQ